MFSVRMVILVGSIAVFASLSAGQPAPQLINPIGPGTGPAATQPAGAALDANSTVDQILDALEQRGQDLESFDGKVSLTETDPDLGLGNVRTGRTMYQKKPAGDARMRVSFDQKIDGQKITNEKLDYLLEGAWLTDRNYDKRIEVRRQVLKLGDKINLLKLGEGPFPLPIGQKNEEVRKLFDVTKIKPSRDDPPGTIHLLLKPIKGTQFEKKFSTLDVWVDVKSNFPVKIETSDAKTTKSTLIENLRINPPLTDGDFKLPAIKDVEWNIHEEPFKQ